MSSSKEDLRKKIVKFYEQHECYGKKFTVNHFKLEGVPISTTYRIITTRRVKRLQGCGRKPKIMDQKGIRKLKGKFSNSDNISQRDAAKEFKCSQSYICRSLKKLQIKCRKKQRSPEYTEEQIQRIKTQCRWMTTNYAGKSLVLDDESYFPLSKSQMPGNNRFYTQDIETTPPNVKYKFKHKFEPKVMLYIAISDKGISKPYFKEGGLAINAETYQNECLKKILIPFVHKYHSDKNFVFWPDKASSHYAKTTQELLKSKNINFVPKERNPTNLPQCRPIEDFFGNLSSLVYKNNWRAKNCEELKKRIRSCIRKMDPNPIQMSCRGIFRKLRLTADNGPYATVH